MVEGLLRSGYVRSPTVRAAFLRVPREAFVRPEDRGATYQDIPLPIGFGQTISAPSMIAIMLEEAQLEPGERVLEVGTGSGYHAALLAAIVGPSNVVSIERHTALAEHAREVLAAAGFGGVTVIDGDGSLGFPGRAPYDCILATAGAPRVPESWPPQLAPRGRIVAPVGHSPHSQVLVVVTRQEDGTFETREGTPCAFVPLIGKQAWPA
jgi:protein-L-isoaspartate(D-aspartate) O-methyltransferase